METPIETTEPRKADEIFFVLEKLIGLHRNLIDLLQEEFSHMTNLEVKGLVEVAHAKEILLGEIWSLERSRIALVEDFGKHTERDPAGLTLSEIASMLSEPDEKRLKTTKDILLLLVTRAREANSRNMGFAQSSLERIETMKMNALGVNNNNTKENYSNSGTRQAVTEQGGRLLSTEA